MLKLALCLLAVAAVPLAAAAPPASAPLASASASDGAVGTVGREAELLSMIEQMQRDMRQEHERVQKMSEELAEQRHLTKRLRTTSSLRLAASEDDKGRFHDKLAAFFHGIKALATQYLGPFLLSDTMFYLSLLMVIQWHIRFHLAEFIFARCFKPLNNSGLLSGLAAGDLTRRKVKPMMMPRKLGLNILILGIYYDKDLPWSLEDFVANRPFFCSALLIFFDLVVIYYSFFILGCIVNPGERDEEEYTDPVDETEQDGFCPEKLEANNVYEDLTLKFRRAMPIWFVQMMLFTLYLEDLNQNADTKDVHNVDFNYWVVGVVFQMYGGDDQVGEAYNDKFWRRVLNGSGPDFKDYVLSLFRRGAGGGGEMTEQLLDQEGGQWRWYPTTRSRPGSRDGCKRSSTRMHMLQSLLYKAAEKKERKAAQKEDTERKVKKVLHMNGNAEDFDTDAFDDAKNDLLEDYRLDQGMLRKGFSDVSRFTHKVFHCIPMKLRWEWHLRRFMDFTVNSVARSVILYTVPIMVCVEEPLDFVKDLTAVMFITTLDNMDDGKKDLYEVLVKLKFSAYYNEEAEKEKCKMTLFEKDFAEENEDETFDRIRDMVPDKWEDFKNIGQVEPEDCEEDAKELRKFQTQLKAEWKLLKDTLDDDKP